MTELDKKIDALLAKQGLSKDEPDTAKPAAKKKAKKKAVAKKKRTAKKKAQKKKAPAKKKSKKRPARAKKNTSAKPAGAGGKKAKATAKPKKNNKPPAKLKTVNGVHPEQFAHKYIQNNCQAVQAYRELRPDVKDSTARAEAYKALKSPEVQKVLWPLLEAIMEREEAKSEEIIKRWLEQAEASPLDYFHITERGQLGGIDLTDLTPAQRRNLKSIQISDTKYGQNIKVTVVDQQKATELLGRMLGMLQTNIDPETEDRIGDLLEAGVKRIQRKMDADAWKEAAIEGEFTDVG